MLIKLSTLSCLEIRTQDEVSVRVNNSSIEIVEEFNYLGTNLTNQNSIQEEIKSRWKLGNACYYSVQIFFFQFVIQKFKNKDI
jgi:hypothetical protein